MAPAMARARRPCWPASSASARLSPARGPTTEAPTIRARGVEHELASSRAVRPSVDGPVDLGVRHRVHGQPRLGVGGDAERRDLGLGVGDPGHQVGCDRAAQAEHRVARREAAVDAGDVGEGGVAGQVAGRPDARVGGAQPSVDLDVAGRRRAPPRRPRGRGGGARPPSDRDEHDVEGRPRSRPRAVRDAATRRRPTTSRTPVRTSMPSAAKARARASEAGGVSPGDQPVGRLDDRDLRARAGRTPGRARSRSGPRPAPAAARAAR